MTLVIDEYGELQGLVTLQDVFERSSASSGRAGPRTRGRCSARRLVAPRRPDPIPELTDRLGLSEEAEDERAGYQTLSGLVMWCWGACRRPATS